MGGGCFLRRSGDYFVVLKCFQCIFKVFLICFDGFLMYFGVFWSVFGVCSGCFDGVLKEMRG